MSANMKLSIKKHITLAVTGAFLISSVFGDFAFAGNERKLDNIERSVENSILIDSNYYNNDTLIVHILDAHNDPDAQKKISDIINFYDSRKPIEKIFAEGAPLGKVSLDLFKGIDENLKKNILNKMLSDSQIGACEYYVSYNDRDILFGIEDSEIYNKNLKLIQDMLALNRENKEFLNNISAKIEILKKLHLSKSLLDIEKSIEEKNRNSYSKIKSFLKKDAAFDESLYQNYFTYLRSKEQSGKVNYKNAIKEVSSLNKYLSTVMPYKEYTRVSSLMAESDDKAAIAEAYSIINDNAPEAQQNFPAIMSVLKMNYLSMNMNTYDVYLQKQAFKKYIFDNYASEEEKEVLYLSDMVESVKQIYLLSITREDFLNFINARTNIRNVSAKYLDIAERNTLIYLAENKITDLIYNNNLQRDLIFFNAVKNTIDLNEKAEKDFQNRKITGINDFSRIIVVVTGGFHLEFTDFLRKNKISYLNVAPKLEKNSERKQYIDSIDIPGKLGSKNIVFEKSAFAPPLLNAVNNNENPALRGIIIKNIIAAWVNSAEEAGLVKEDIYMDMLGWLTEHGVSIETIKSIKELSFLADISVAQKEVPENENIAGSQPDADLKEKNIPISDEDADTADAGINQERLPYPEDASSSENTETALAAKRETPDTLPVSEQADKSLFARIKNKLGVSFQHWSFPEVVAAYPVIRSAKSYQELVNIIKNIKKVSTIELEVKSGEGGFYIECSEGFNISVEEVLDIVEKFARKKRKTKILLKLDESIVEDPGKVLGLTLKRKNKFVIISGDKKFVSSVDVSLYKNVSMAYKMPSGLSAVEALEEIKELTSRGVFGLHVDKNIFDSVGSYLFSKYEGKYLNLYIQDGRVEEQYSDFIFDGRAKSLLISSEPMTHLEQKKRSLAAYRNISATPIIQLVIGFEFFASFSMLYLNGQGYDLSFLSAMFAICGVLNIVGSLVSSYASKFFGKRNVLIANLFLHCAGDTLLLVAGWSPVFLGLALGVPAMAAAGIATLLVPFLHSSLKAVGREHKFESVYGKTRSIFWIGLALSSILGSWVATVISPAFVIAMSCSVITVLSIYSFITTGTIKENGESEMTDEEKEFSNLKEGKKIIQGIKTVFTTKGLNTIVILNFIVDSVLFVLLALGVQPMLDESGLSLALLGVVAFSANIMQSIASKFASKVSSIVNSTFKRTLYFASLAALAAGFIAFGNPVFLIALYVLANFWQGASSVIEPTKVEEKLTDDVSPYWFSAKTIINSGLTAVVQLALAAAFTVFSVDVILIAVIGVITFASAVLGAVFKDKIQKGKGLKEKLSNSQYTKQLLSAA